MIEAFVFTACVIFYIWFLRASWSWTVLGLVAAVSVSFWRRSETFGSLGLSPRAFLAAIPGLKIWWFIALVAVVVFGWSQTFSEDTPQRSVVYFLWCSIQQIVYQNVVYKRMRERLGPSWQAWLLSGVMFAATHWPNPVLVPATLVWGALSSRLFERYPSVPALALLQTLFSSVLLWLTPPNLHRNFRVGPGYKSWSHSASSFLPKVFQL